jgi:hypothetical protein
MGACMSPKQYRLAATVGLPIARSVSDRASASLTETEKTGTTHLLIETDLPIGTIARYQTCTYIHQEL